MEPGIEIYQQKGSSECSRLAGAPDELCGFEDFPFENFTALTLRRVRNPRAQAASPEMRSPAGSSSKKEFGVNPFRYAVIAGTDAHMSQPGFSRGIRPSRAMVTRSRRSKSPPDPEGAGTWSMIPTSVPAAWPASGPKRTPGEAIFEAIRRKETFGTSGPRIVPRFYGGWDYPDGHL